MVVLDRITYPLIYGWLPLEGVLQTLRDRPADVHRECSPAAAPKRSSGWLTR